MQSGVGKRSVGLPELDYERTGASHVLILGGMGLRVKPCAATWFKHALDFKRGQGHSAYSFRPDLAEQEFPFGGGP